MLSTGSALLCVAQSCGGWVTLRNVRYCNSVVSKVWLDSVRAWQCIAE